MANLRRADGVVYEVVDDCAVLVDPAGRKLITLNAVGSLVWEALATDGDAPSLAAALHPRFTGVDVQQLQADIASFLDELRAVGLVVDRA